MFRLTIKATNDAFAEDPNEEIARIIELAAAQVREGLSAGPCIDLNGNRVGEWTIG
jgi:hypothetical protein